MKRWRWRRQQRLLTTPTWTPAGEQRRRVHDPSPRVEGPTAQRQHVPPRGEGKGEGESET